jgi:NADPH2:quinone reductase
VVGDGVENFAVGDEVLGYSLQRASHATYVSVPVSQLIPKPVALDWVTAGSLYVVGCTAWAAVHAIDPQPGQAVAVSTAAGGVGTLVTQLLKLRGIHVIGIASPASADTLLALGAVPVAYGAGLAERIVAAALSTFRRPRSRRSFLSTRHSKWGQEPPAVSTLRTATY